MFTVQQSTATLEVLQFASAGASCWSFVGAIIRRVNSTATVYNVVTIVNTAATAIDQLPHSHLFQWCWVDGITNNGAIVPTRRGFQADGYRFAFLNSVASGFAYTGSDTQAILTLSGAGRIKVVDSLLEASSENFMSGGSAPNANWLPADMEFRRVYFPTRQQWNKASPLFYGGATQVKNCFEMKHGLRVLCEACVFENSWLDAQTGAGLVIKTSPSQNTRNTGTQDITFLHCIVKDVGIPFVYVAMEAVISPNAFALNRVDMTNVLAISNTSARVNGGALAAMQLSGGGSGNFSGTVGPYSFRWVTVASRNATGFENLMRFYAPIPNGASIENSVFDYAGVYGITTDTANVDAAGLVFRNVNVRRNALPESPQWIRRVNFVTPFPDQSNTNLWSLCPTSPSPRAAPTNWFADRATSNYRPHPNATYLGLGDGGYNPGADIDFIETVTSGVKNPPSFIIVDFA